MTFQHKDLWPWLDPWPIALRGKAPRWEAQFMDREQLRDLTVFWTDRGTSVSAGDAELKIRKAHWLGKDHQIASIVRSGRHRQRPIIVTNKYGRVIDGNHTLMALLRDRKWKGKALVFRMATE